MIDAFLASAGWDGAARIPLSGDASARRYDRVTLAGRRCVLMIAPPEDRTSFEAFVTMAAYLRGCGLSAPEIFATDIDAGLMLLEDFGDAQISVLSTEDPGQERALYSAASDVLIRLAGCPVAQPLTLLTPARLVEMMLIGFDLIPDAAERSECSAAVLPKLAMLFTSHLSGPMIVILRDYHADNLIWLKDRKGIARVGLLDFQDAAAGPAGYDLISLLDDARRDVPAMLKAELISAHADVLGLPRDAFALRCALLSVQRNLRILGVFDRLASVRGKPGYLRHVPRVAGHILQAVRHPALNDISAPLTRLTDHALRRVSQ